MSHEISRMYASARAAQAAVDELREEGFDDIFIVSPPVADDTPVSAIAAQIALGRVLLSDAKIYAVGVKNGGTLVTVHAPFSTGKLATSILESHGPVPSGMVETPEPKLWDEAAPLSSALFLPVLSDDPAPMSKVMGIPALAGPDCSLSEAVGLPLLSKGEMPEGRWGFRFLIDNPAPLSSLLGLPVLLD